MVFGANNLYYSDCPALVFLEVFFLFFIDEMLDANDLGGSLTPGLLHILARKFSLGVKVEEYQ